MPGDRACRLVLGQHRYPTPVPLVLRERRGEKEVDEAQGIGLGMVSGPDADDVRVIVFAGQSRRFVAPDERGPHATHLVRGDLFTVARPTDHDAEAGRLGGGAGGGGDARRRVVIQGIQGVRATVDRFVASGVQMLDQPSLELEARVITTQEHPHDRHHRSNTGR